jgi:hypothetical protein
MSDALLSHVFRTLTLMGSWYDAMSSTGDVAPFMLTGVIFSASEDAQFNFRFGPRYAIAADDDDDRSSYSSSSDRSSDTSDTASSTDDGEDSEEEGEDDTPMLALDVSNQHVKMPISTMASHWFMSVVLLPFMAVDRAEMILWIRTVGLKKHVVIGREGVPDAELLSWLDALLAGQPKPAAVTDCSDCYLPGQL